MLYRSCILPGDCVQGAYGFDLQAVCRQQQIRCTGFWFLMERTVDIGCMGAAVFWTICRLKDDGDFMAKTIPMIITNNNILVKDKESDEFKPFSLPGTPMVANIPFYHHYAAKISESQHYFREFIKSLYGKKLSKNILAIIVPDDTTALESIFINELFVNSEACKAVAQMKMGQTLSKTDECYVSVSKSSRNVVLQYIKNNEIIVSRYYDAASYNADVIKADAKRLHIDIEYKQVPVYVNDFNMNMEEFSDMGQVISPKEFMKKIAVVDVEKL